MNMQSSFAIRHHAFRPLLRNILVIQLTSRKSAILTKPAFRPLVASHRCSKFEDSRTRSYAHLEAAHRATFLRLAINLKPYLPFGTAQAYSAIGADLLGEPLGVSGGKESCFTPYQGGN